MPSLTYSARRPVSGWRRTIGCVTGGLTSISAFMIAGSRVEVVSWIAQA
jgi:hypothetical protein